ncbi:MAG: DUF2877 domain-containing protein [Streptosporangiales bacterium]|nr:DUF2877 domain-containing protein [Streptosporangiales bacterium]
MPRPWRSDRDRPPLAGAASLGLRPLLDGPRRPGRVLAAFPSAVYVEVRTGREPRVLGLVIPEAVRLPNAVVVTAPELRAQLASVQVGTEASVGDGVVELGGVRVRARRWWDPAPVLGPVSRIGLERGVAALQRLLDRCPRHHGLTGHPAPGNLATACVAGDLAGTVDAAERIVGLGPGLTPSGDDMLAGLLVALRVLGGAVAEGADTAGGRGGEAAGEEAVWLAGWLGAAVTPYADTRTTTLAATLLHCAAQGRPSAEMAAVLRALAGHEPLEPAATRLLATGHTSGADLTWGLLTGCLSILGGARGRRRESA